MTNALRLRFFQAPGTADADAEEAAQTENMAAPAKNSRALRKQERTGNDEESTDSRRYDVQPLQDARGEGLAGVAGVESAEVDLEAKTATVSLKEDVADQVLLDAVKDAGYEPVSCQAQ